MDLIAYWLPGDRIVYIPFDVCRAASTLEYTLRGGTVVTAIILSHQR